MLLRRITVVALLLIVISFVPTSIHAAIVYDNNLGPNQNYTASTTVNANYTPTAGTDSVLVLAYSQDASNSSPTASFGGIPMILAGLNNRTAIFYLLNPGTTPGAIMLKTGANGGAPEIISYGTLTNVDTSIAPKISTGVTRTGATLTGNALTGLASTDYVLGTFFANAAANFINFTSATPSANLSQLAFFSNNATGDYSGVIVGGNPASNGNYMPSAEFVGGTSSGTPGEVGGTFIAFAASPIPEPSLLAITSIGVMGLAFVVQRRRRK